jgi:hypothetical protein
VKSFRELVGSDNGDALASGLRAQFRTPAFPQ